MYSKPFSKDILFRKAELKDLDGIVDVHYKSFSDYFLTNLGKQFLMRYYKEYLENEYTVAVIAQKDNNIIGFIVGTLNSKDPLNKFYRKNFLFIIAKIFFQIFRFNMVICKGIINRTVHIKTALKAILARKRNGSSNYIEHNELTSGRLLSIAILAEYRGKGVAEELIIYFEELLQKNKIKTVGLSVKRENHRAISFYKKMQWLVEKEQGESIYFYKQI